MLPISVHKQVMYVDMRNKYVDKQIIFVNMQPSYANTQLINVNMQRTMLTCKFFVLFQHKQVAC